MTCSTVVRVELQLNCLPNKSAHIARYSREDLDVLEFYELMNIET